MRSDAQEAALGLLGLTGNLDFSKTTTTATTTTATTTTTTTATTAPGLGPSASSSSSYSSSNNHSSSNSTSTSNSIVPGPIPPGSTKRKTLNSGMVVVSTSGMMPRPSSHSQPRSLAILLNDDDDLEVSESSQSLRPPLPAVDNDRGNATTTNAPTSTKTTNNNGSSTATATATASSDGIDCVCGFTYDDGFSVACDNCGTWVHAACFDIQHGNVPEIFKCWKCDKRRWDVEKLRERAVRLQKAQQAREKKELDLMSSGGGEVDGSGGGGGRKRVSSPGVDRKRRVSVAAIEQGGQATKRRRRLSTGASGQQHSTTGAHSGQQMYPSHSTLMNGGGGVGGEEEHVEIDEPATHSYVHTDKDFVPHQHTRDRLKLLAQHWRGVTALESDEDHFNANTPTAPVYLTPDELSNTSRSPKTSIYPLPKAVSQSSMHRALSANMNVQVRPPSYTIRTTQPIPSESYIAPYTSTIIPSTVYLSDPLNSYAHLGMPKPFVHLMGPPLDLALDARLAGNGSRFVRSGCRPNAVIRPVLCRRPQHDNIKNKNKKRQTSVKQDGEDEDEETLTFGVFALRDLKAQEEVVLGWEWDDGSVIHHLPALIDTPHLFAPARFEQYRHQMTSMLHALSSTFTTCACGARARDCALNRLAEFVDGQAGTPPTPSPSPPSSFSFSHNHPIDDVEGGHGQGQGQGQRKRMHTHTSLGPLIGTKRGFRTRERVPMSGGMSGVEMDPSCSGSGGGAWAGFNLHSEAGPSMSRSVNGMGMGIEMERTVSGSSGTTDGSCMNQKGDKKGKGRAMDQDQGQDVMMESEGVNGRRPGGAMKKSKKPLAGSAKPTSSAGSTARSSPQPELYAHPDYGPTPSIPARVGEAKLPPKLRKKWIHKNSEVLKESGSSVEVESLSENQSADKGRSSPSESSFQRRDQMDVDDDSKVMPPPPLPTSVSSPSRPPPIRDLPSRTNTSLLRPPVPADLTSPTTSFANMSLLSPANGPAPHFPGCFGRSSSSGLQGSSGEKEEEMGQEKGDDGDVFGDGVVGGQSTVDEPLDATEPCTLSQLAPQEKEDTSSLDEETSVTGVEETSQKVSNASEDVLMEKECEQQPVVEPEAESADNNSKVSPTEKTPTPPPQSPAESTQPEEFVKTPTPPPVAEKVNTDSEMSDATPTPGLPPASELPSEGPSKVDDVDTAMVVDELPRENPSTPTAPSSEANISSPQPTPEVIITEVVDDKPAESEPEPEPEPPVPAPSPTPAPPAKVKLSLKDFRLRMRKKREEEAAASPVVASVPLAPEGVGASAIESPASTGPIQEQSSPSLSMDTQADAAKPESVSGETLRSPSPVRAPLDKTPGNSSPSSPRPISDASTVERVSANLVHAHVAEDHVQQSQSKVDRDSPMGDRTDSTKPVNVPDKMDVDEHKDVGMTLEAKIEMIEPRLSTAHVEHKPPSRFSAALTDDRLPPSRSRSPIRRTPPTDDRSYSRICSPLSRPQSPRRSEYHSSSSEYSRKENHEPFHLPDRPTMGPPRTIHQPLARQISQEDGEIFSPPPPKPLPLAPRARTPPTRPRLFPHSSSGNTSPTRGPPSSLPPRRPLQASTYRPQLPPAASSRPLPSGPRALRGVGNNGPPPYSSSSSYSPSFPSRSDGPHTAPRGPSADRDRDRERIDWERDRRVGPSWSRSRGSGWPR